MNIINIEETPLRNRRFRVFLLDGTKYDIGTKKGEYYIDHGNKEIRTSYYIHLDKKALRVCRRLQSGAQLYETFILNGPTTDIIKNVNFYNREILRNF